MIGPATRREGQRGERFDGTPRGCYDHSAGWSSLVARWAHNPKVGGSNPPPATKIFRDSFLQVSRILKVASRAVCMDFLVQCRVLVPCSKTWNNFVTFGIALGGQPEWENSTWVRRFTRRWSRR